MYKRERRFNDLSACRSNDQWTIVQPIVRLATHQMNDDLTGTFDLAGSHELVQIYQENYEHFTWTSDHSGDSSNLPISNPDSSNDIGAVSGSSELVSEDYDNLNLQPDDQNHVVKLVNLSDDNDEKLAPNMNFSTKMDTFGESIPDDSFERWATVYGTTERTVLAIMSQSKKTREKEKKELNSPD